MAKKQQNMKPETLGVVSTLSSTRKQKIYKNLQKSKYLDTHFELKKCEVLLPRNGGLGILM